MTDRSLSRREREVVEVVYARGGATVAEVQASLKDDISYSATRMVLQRLHKKGKLTAERDGNRYVYQAVTPTHEAGVRAFRNLVDTFFAGSTSQAVSALLGEEEEISAEELDALETLINDARKQQR